MKMKEKRRERRGEERGERGSCVLVTWSLSSLPVTIGGGSKRH
jgi:hypothetical protein